MSLTASTKSPAGFEQFLKQHLDRELLRFTTAGSVDDGKSTLIGRLLHDSKSVYEDQLASIKKSRINRSTGPIDFSLLTDGLRAEREQGITIDVAYRYFSTSRRKFIIADTPGHEQYTRNMATGASGAHLAVILIDGSKGLLPQSRRHTYIASLLGIKQVVAAINKMDLVDYDEAIFALIRSEFLTLAAQLGIPDAECIPISALEGDNIVTRSSRMPWYVGPTLLEHLETVPVPAESPGEYFRFPVQYVVRPDATFRGFAGRIAGGTVHPGDEVLALPSGRKTCVKSIVTYDGELAEAYPPMSVTLQLEDEIDLSRGEMLVAPARPPLVSRRFTAMLVWMNEQPMRPGRAYLLKHTSRQLRTRALTIRYRIDVNTLKQVPSRQLVMNDIALVEFESSSPLYFDPYQSNRVTGSFILIDPISNATVAAGMIEDSIDAAATDIEQSAARAGNEVGVAPKERFAEQGHYPAVIAVPERLSGRLERALFDAGFRAVRVKTAGLSSEALTAVVRALYDAGVIAVLGRAENDDVADVADLARRDLPAERYFDLSQLASDADGDAYVRELLRLAEGLRIRKLPGVN